MLAALDEIPDPGVHQVRLTDGRSVCLVRVGDRVTAFLDECPHSGMPLSAGEVLGAASWNARARRAV
ncbi:MAG: Rieske 2Fe-2S domain-containing protein [Gemmatimonadaceae bacterium]